MPPNIKKFENYGLDWKSLKCPACLPITTDYCPPQNHLQSAYTEHAYTLIPDDLNFSDEKGDEEKKEFGKRYQSARELFLELINQRLCQGFQLIKQSKRLRTTDSTSSCATLTSPTASDGSFRSYAAGVSPLCYSPGNLDGDRTPNGFMLSHGRQYHVLRISSDDEKIEVKIYRPRHPSLTLAISYKYMLWPITREEFQTASTTFAHTKAEDQFWNHLDNYICYPDESMNKDIIYWRTKFVAVAVPTKRLHLLRSANENNSGPKRFDVFNACGCQTPHKNHQECTALFDGFVRFLEHLNKFKRNNTQSTRKSWKSHTSGSFVKSYQATPCAGGGGANSNQATPTPPRATSSTPTSERSTPVRFFHEAPPPALSENLMHRGDIQHPVPRKHANSDSSSSPSDNKKLSINSEMCEIIEAMKDEQTGINFLPEKSDIPKHTFVSLDAVHWAIDNVDGLDSIKAACDHLERIRSYGFFAQLTGDGIFQYGYLLYTLNNKQQHFELEDPTSYQFHHITPTGGYNQVQNRWFEVVFKHAYMEDDLCFYHRAVNLPYDDSRRPRSGAFFIPNNKNVAHEKHHKPGNNLVKIPLLNKPRSQRSEWFQIKYSSATRCGVDNFVFCFEVQWLIATATCLFNLLQLWYRDAARCELYFFPVPCHPFAFPRSGATGPLRCPLFVKLNLSELSTDSIVFKDYMLSPEKYRIMIIEFMDAILRMFGFLRDEFNDEDDYDVNLNLSQNYIHFTGQVLAQIPVRERSVQRNSISLRNRSFAAQFHTPPVSQSELDGTGFYWSYNHMQTKRWRHSSLDECQPAELEKDFLTFCSNTNSRLFNFFHDFSTEVNI